MRIVINASAVSSVKGGASFYIINIVKAITGLNLPHEYIVMCTRSGKSIFTSFPGVSKCSATVPKNVVLRLIWEQIALPFICLRYRADILFSPNYTMPLIGFGYRNVVTIFDLSFFPLSNLYPRSRRLFKPIIRTSVRRANEVVAISMHTKNDISRYTGTPGDKTTVIYCAADDRFTNPDALPTYDVRSHFALQKPYIMFTGFLEPRKNLNRLLAAYGKVCDRIVHDLVIVGGNGWWYEDLPGIVKKTGVAERIRFLGYVPDEYLPALYREAALFAFVSLYEGFGIAALESICCGTPVLASNNTSLPEVVGEAGIYTDPYDTDDIAEKLCCVNDQHLMLALRNKCPDIARQFSWTRAALETMAVFEKAAGSKKDGITGHSGVNSLPPER